MAINTTSTILMSNVTAVSLHDDSFVGIDNTLTALEDTPIIVDIHDFSNVDEEDYHQVFIRISRLPIAGVLTFDGIAVVRGQLISINDIKANKLVFTPSANENGDTYASIKFQVIDDVVASNVLDDEDSIQHTLTINVTPVNDAPNGNNSTLTTLEDTALVIGTSAFAITDLEHNGLLAVKITDLPTHGVLTLDGNAVAVGQYIAATDIASHALVYKPDANANGTAYVTFGFQVQDDGGTTNGGIDLDPNRKTITITVTPVNDAPILSGLAHSITYTEDTAPVVLSSSASVYDEELSALNNYAGSSLTIGRDGGGNAEDQFDASGNVSFDADNVIVSGVIVGSVYRLNGIITLTFNDNATQAVVNEVISSIAYSNSSQNPTSNAQILWTFDDGNTGAQGLGDALSASVTTIVNLYGVNDAPILNAFAGPVGTNKQGNIFPINFETLVSLGDASDVDGYVSAFTIKSLASGSLLIGSNLESATPWDSVSNYTVDATHQAFWTPSTDVTGILNAFAVVAVDDGGLESTPPVQVPVAVIPADHWDVSQYPTLSFIAHTVFNGMNLTLPPVITVSQGAGLGGNAFFSSTDVVGNELVVNWMYQFVIPGTKEIKQVSSSFNTIQLSVQDVTRGIQSIEVPFNLIKGDVRNNNLLAVEGVNILLGGAGKDTLTGFSGDDILCGGTGNDNYIVNNTHTSIVESFGEGTDSVQSSVDYVLPANLDNLILTGTHNLIGTGNSLNNKLYANLGMDTLVGGVGFDTLIGGSGDDTFVVNITSLGRLEDKIVPGSAINSIQEVGLYSGSLYTQILPLGIQNFDISGTGRSLVNLTGNASSNILIGNDSNNTIDGKGGVDTLVGGLGDDIYIIDNSADFVLELVGQGIDLIKSSVNFNMSVNAINVENIKLLGSSAVMVDGNSLNNMITGSSLGNILNGNEGDDTLVGGYGNDTLTGGAGKDSFWFDSVPNTSTNQDIITDFITGVDKLQFSASVLVLLGGSKGQFSINDPRFTANSTGIADNPLERFIYNTTSGQLSYDINGSAHGGSNVLEVLGTSTHPVLVATDIVIV